VPYGSPVSQVEAPARQTRRIGILGIDPREDVSSPAAFAAVADALGVLGANGVPYQARDLDASFSQLARAPRVVIVESHIEELHTGYCKNLTSLRQSSGTAVDLFPSPAYNGAS
jgi:hypothetical protein